MAKVRVLADQVANQIAAGEVIERPASVIKELVENSIDAGATRIEVEFRHGGTSLMRIEDNGSGMGRDDALLALERHATSKIRSAKDLDELTTMGFRGEALPSIASVSRFQLQTREAEAEAGTEIVVDGGRMLHARDCGMPPGTRMTVSKLFNTVPARRKFLKSLTTEAAHIVHCVRLYALAHPEIGFTLIDDGRILFQSPACSRLEDRVSEIFGRQIAGNLIEIEAEEEGMRLSGLIGKPSLSRTSRHEMLFFVNRRPVDNKTLSYALVESYYGHIPKGRYPVAFLFLRIAPDLVDVNVHPAKREIRFREEAKARGFAVRTLLQALRGEPAPAAPAVNSESATPASALLANPPPMPPTRRLIAPAPLPPVEPHEAVAREIVAQRAALQARPAASVAAPDPPPSAAPLPAPGRPGRNWEYLGWAQGEFAIFDTGSGVVLLHTKAAQQRIWYERLLQDFGNRTAASQRLLLPRPLDFDPVSAALVEENLEFFGQFGFDIAPFGRNFFRVEGTPTWLEESKLEEFLREIVALLRQGSLSSDKRGAASELMAKQGALRAARLNAEPKEEELGPLLEQLFRCEKPLSDLEGRPTLIEISAGEIDKRFHRRNRTQQPELF